MDLEASVGEGSDPVLGETPPRLQAPLDGAVVVERLVPHLDDQKREPGVRLVVVPSSGCALTGRCPSTTTRSQSPTSPSSPTRYGGRRIPRRGTRPQLDRDGVLASLGRPGAQVSVEQLELGVRLERTGFDRAFELGPARTVVAADRDRNGGLRHRASYDPPLRQSGSLVLRPRERAEVRPESTGRRGRFRRCRPRGRLPSMLDTLAVAQQLAAALDRQRAGKGPAAGCCLMPREHEPDE